MIGAPTTPHARRSPPTESSSGRVHLWRTWRGPLLVIAVVLLGSALVAFLQRSPAVTGPLDPRSTAPSGAHAIVDLLAARGQAVSRVDTAAAAVTQARGSSAVIVITDSAYLPDTALAALRHSPGNLLLIAPDAAALAELAPHIALAGPAGLRPVAAGCSLPAARLAGPVVLGGELLRPDAPGGWLCYPWRSPGSAGQPPVSLARYASGGRIITVLGTGAPFTNLYLAQQGDAALALNLLSTGHRIIWLVRPPGALPVPAGSPASSQSLIPPAATWIALELAIAVLLAAAWRIRRFGPLVAEPIPVPVRASETVRGHGRLYRERRARARAAVVLRQAVLARILPRLGLPYDAVPDTICQELAARTQRDESAIRAILFGSPPAGDAGLVALAGALDTLEGQVLTQ